MEPSMTTMDQVYSTIVIGAGQAGPGLARSLAVSGGEPDKSVALIEAVEFGGTCLNSGCRPTKAMRASARAAHVARSSAGLGVHVGDVRVDFGEVIARKDRLIDDWRDHYTESFENAEGIDYIIGRAQFLGTDPDGHRVGANDRTLVARRVIINTGARSVAPRIEGLDEIDWLDHKSLMRLSELPQHLVVLGGSYIALEFGQIFRRLGSQVTIIEVSDRIISREDPEVSSAVASLLANEGITIRTGAKVVQVRAHGEGAVVILDDGSAVGGSHVLVAAGRIPNSDDLGLDTVGVAVDERGYIVTNDVFATNIDGIYAVGDVNGRGAFTHTSYQDYEILADHLSGGSRSVAGRIATYALFTDPPLGRVGMTIQQARDHGLDVSVSVYPMSKVTRYRSVGRSQCSRC
jgi:pyruvate/2-oxoglutarate dehydrogenase complex dihydrolipoamide dehydrogenase (E3) component